MTKDMNFTITMMLSDLPGMYCGKLSNMIKNLNSPLHKHIHFEYDDDDLSELMFGVTKVFAESDAASIDYSKVAYAVLHHDFEEGKTFLSFVLDKINVGIGFSKENSTFAYVETGLYNDVNHISAEQFYDKISKACDTMRSFDSKDADKRMFDDAYKAICEMITDDLNEVPEDEHWMILFPEKQTLSSGYDDYSAITYAGITVYDTQDERLGGIDGCNVCLNGMAMLKIAKTIERIQELNSGF